MKIEWIKVPSLAIVVLAILVFSTIIVSYGFPTFKYALPSEELIEVEATAIGPEVGRFLWTNRSIDLIAQAFVLFAAAVCCLALLRGREKK